MSSKKLLAENDDVFVLDFNFWWHGRSNSRLDVDGGRGGGGGGDDLVCLLP